MTTLTDAHAIVTGGSEGIGLATAAALRDRGARVSIVSRSAAKLAAAAAHLGGSVRTAAADVADPDALASAFAQLCDAQGPCDVLVTSAGYAHPATSRTSRSRRSAARWKSTTSALCTRHGSSCPR